MIHNIRCLESLCLQPFQVLCESCGYKTLTTLFINGNVRLSSLNRGVSKRGSVLNGTPYVAANIVPNFGEAVEDKRIFIFIFVCWSLVYLYKHVLLLVSIIK